ncbi:cytidine deaminase [Phaeocystidibacter luteus]|uniref:Cytidine deaminase n=1 Tax=Phaeocystidibacter luteus TaxID=911197 RepID=A0A6N6RJK3_9FLAO|nr:cytidine deaminase [Phaeocystidibacter luteus]KAB2813801.1 cytidine deaminase [Phaeocystidibacter luteus]
MKKNTWSVEYTFGKLEDLSVADRALVNKAFESREHAYAPYSFYKVGAAVLLKDGDVVVGSNQENAAYPSGLCAERVALFAVGAQFPGKSIDTLAIATAAHGEVPATSCGSCRQVMHEFEHRQEKPIRVIFADEEGNVLITNSVADLMPFAFDAKRLG